MAIQGRYGLARYIHIRLGTAQHHSLMVYDALGQKGLFFTDPWGKHPMFLQRIHGPKTDVVSVIGVCFSRISQPYDHPVHHLFCCRLLIQFYNKTTSGSNGGDCFVQGAGFWMGVKHVILKKQQTKSRIPLCVV
jgi:hypothetical protein